MIPAGTALDAVQVQLGSSPVAGRVDADGRLIHVGKLEGWWDPPASSGSNTQKVNDHGVYLSPAYYGPRVVNLEVRIDGFSPADSMATARRFLQALDVDALTMLTVTDEAGTLTASVRQEADPVLVRAGNRVTVSLSMLSPKSAKYGAVQTTVTGLPFTTGGLSLPLSGPVSVGATQATGVVTVNNDGDLDGSLVFTVLGNTPGPFTITDGAGRQIYLPATVPAGRFLRVDCDNRLALLDGTTLRAALGTWPRLVPGPNQYLFSAAAYDATASLTVTSRPAWR